MHVMGRGEWFADVSVPNGQMSATECAPPPEKKKNFCIFESGIVQFDEYFEEKKIEQAMRWWANIQK